MAPPHCEIRFDDNPQGVFQGGQTLTGSVVLRLDKPILVNDFRLVISGSADVRWNVLRSRQRSVTYVGKEELLRAETKLIPQRDESTEIAAGVHVYNFASPIPLNVPTSFEGECGKIRYTVRAILDRPWKFDQTCTAAFTVLKPLDLNHHISNLKVRKKQKLIKTFCCWPCASNPLHIQVEIPMSGYVSGQKIPITVSLNNTSNTRVTGIKSSLQRKVSYISQHPKQKTRVMSKFLSNDWTAVTHDESATYLIELDVPEVAPTGKCSVLVIEYLLVVIVYVSGLHLNSRVELPITIGTIPFPSSPTVSTTTATVSNEQTDETLTAIVLPLSVANDEALPPSYEEAMSGLTININDDHPSAI
ncbi:arrestin domain-containing protein 3-like [Armigeres subalbatus]|uniref:arrestin domain-containing protein 3-like n=1 Tax=Armigeres subalbatus TaxID=124917 RepID=UPI002ED51D49